MKCVRYNNNGKVGRVTEEKATELFEAGLAVYVSKSVWRAERP